MSEIVRRWCDFYREIRSINSLNRKKVLVQKYHDLTPLWRYVFDPSKSTHMTCSSIHRHKLGTKRRKVCTDEITLLQLMERLTTRSLLGNAALDTVLSFIERYPEASGELTVLFGGNPKVGVDVKSINQALTASGHEPVCRIFAVSLAHMFDAELFSKSSPETWFIMRKYDGIRCLIHLRDRVAYTRNGNVISSIQSALEKINVPDEFKDFYIDSEICVVRDGKEEFKSSVSRFRQTRVQIEDFKCFAFDLIPLTVFEEGCATVWSKRMQQLQCLCGQMNEDRIVPIEFERYSEETFARWQKRRQDLLWEGLILRKDVGYECDRTYNLLKIKAFQSMEAIVTDITIATKQELNTYTRIMSAAVISYKGSYVYVGSGWSDEQRLKYVRNPSEIVGKTIEINHFGEMHAKGTYSLRFPTLKHVWGETRDM